MLAGVSGAFAIEGSRAGEVRTFGGIEMVWCPPGEFLMGSPEGEEGRSRDETQHRVNLTRGFWLAKCECTQGQWEAVMGSNLSQFKGADLPVESVSWDDVQGWLTKMNERHPLPEGWEWDLPTEAQWEYACRAGTKTAFSFGNDPSQLHKFGNFADKNVGFSWKDAGQDDGVGEMTAKVGSYSANAWGLHDMHGNVWEWCLDWFGDYPSGSATDPTGPKSGVERVYRGGSWKNGTSGCRAAQRARLPPDYRYHLLGFRPAAVPSGR